MNVFWVGVLAGLTLSGGAWYLAGLIVRLWLSPLLDKYDRGHK